MQPRQMHPRYKFSDRRSVTCRDSVYSRIFGGWAKMMVLFFAVSGPTFMKFWDDVGDPRSLQRCFPIVSIMFPDGDIGPQICHWSAKSSKIGRFWAPGVHYRGLPPKFGWVLSAKLRVWTRQRQKTQNFRREGKMRVLFFAVSGPTFMKFQTM